MQNTFNVYEICLIISCTAASICVVMGITAFVVARFIKYMIDFWLKDIKKDF